MQQDTLQHHDIVPLPAEVEAGTEEDGILEEESRPLSVWQHRPAVADTIPPDPKQMKPLAPDMPLAMRPRLMADDYWAHGLLTVEPSEFVAQLDSATGRSCEVTTLEARGMAGDPTPYRFRTDNFVTALLMVSFFLVIWVISRSRHFLERSVKDFFYTRQHENLFAERTENELRGQLFLIFQTCFVLGVLFFDCTQELQVEVFNQVSPYKILGMSTGIFCLYFLLKISIYSFINSVFFTREQCKKWSEAHLLSILAVGLFLFPVALLVVYFDLSFHHLMICSGCIAGIVELLIFYKLYSIFFRSSLGWVHLILYFCTLEITPLLILWRALIYANGFLLTIN